MEACKFKKGDKVRVVKPVVICGDFKGEVGIVSTDPTHHYGGEYTFEVDFDSSSQKAFDQTDALELVEEESYTFVDPSKQLHNTMGVDWFFDKGNSAISVDDLLPMGNLVGDNVDHPSHYGNGSIECIEYLEDFLSREEFIGYLRGNIGKYMHRWRYKNGLEDLRKAEWYLKKLIEVMEKANE